MCWLTQNVHKRIMEAPEYLDLDEIDFSDDISVSTQLILFVQVETSLDISVLI